MGPLDLLTPDQLAGELQVTPKTLENWRARRIGPPFVRLNRQVRYSRAAVHAWLQQQAQEQTA